MFNPTTLVGFHTLISFVAIAAGLAMLAQMLKGAWPQHWIAPFLVTAILTSATGFLFPLRPVLPSHVVGGVALVVLAVTLAARYIFRLAGPWLAIYVGGLVISLYLLLFVGVAQAFLKIPALHRLAPTQAEPPFAIAQGLLLVLMAGLGWRAVKQARPRAVPA